MGAIYRVRYETTWHAPGVRGSSYNDETELSVSSDGDAEAAVAKAKKYAFSDSWMGEHGEGKKVREVKYVCKRFLLISVERIALADI